MSEFRDLPLHDSVVTAINLDWAKHRVEISLSAFVGKGEVAEPYRLEFHGVAHFEAPHTAPWGESASINAISESTGRYELEMQSGDVLTIEAAGFRFLPGS